MKVQLSERMSQSIKENRFSKRERTKITRKQQAIQMHVIDYEQE